MRSQSLLHMLALASWAVAVFVVAGGGPATADSLKSNKVGCFARGDVERLSRVIAEAGSDAFVRLADKLQTDGRCLPLRAGHAIEIEDAGPRYVCLASAPGLPCAWTWRAGLSK